MNGSNRLEEKIETTVILENGEVDFSWEKIKSNLCILKKRKQ